MCERLVAKVRTSKKKIKLLTIEYFPCVTNKDNKIKQAKISQRSKPAKMKFKNIQEIDYNWL